MEITIKNVLVCAVGAVILLITIFIVSISVYFIPTPESSDENVNQPKTEKRRRRRSAESPNSSQSREADDPFFVINSTEYRSFLRLDKGRILSKLRTEISENDQLLPEIKFDEALSDSKLRDLLDILSISLFVEIKNRKENVEPIGSHFDKRMEEPLLSCKSLCIRDLKVNRIPEMSFVFFKSLKRLIMSSCLIDDRIWSSDFGRYLVLVESLDLSFNRFRKIPDVSKFASLKELNLNWNVELTVTNITEVKLFDGSGVVKMDHTLVSRGELSDLENRYKGRIEFDGGTESRE